MIEKLPFDLVPLLIDTTVHTHCSLLKKYICNNDPAIFNG